MAPTPPPDGSLLVLTVVRSDDKVLKNNQQLKAARAGRSSFTESEKLFLKDNFGAKFAFSDSTGLASTRMRIVGKAEQFYEVSWLMMARTVKRAKTKRTTNLISRDILPTTTS